MINLKAMGCQVLGAIIGLFILEIAGIITINYHYPDYDWIPENPLSINPDNYGKYKDRCIEVHVQGNWIVYACSADIMKTDIVDPRTYDKSSDVKDNAVYIEVARKTK